jgi:SAM-dependent methyltransferase
MIEDNADRFEWTWYGTRSRRTAMRAGAVERFVADLGARPSQYVAAALPDLPFADDSFDLVLCSHLLFTWADQFDQRWHRTALLEMARVARREVRVFPLVLQGTGEPLAFLPALCEELETAGYRTEQRKLPYRFQRGANHMLAVMVAESSAGVAEEARSHR